MRPISELADAIHQQWKERNYALEVFPEVAAEGLTRACLPEQLKPRDILDWLENVGENYLPRQADLSNSFGEPAVTLWRGERFFVDALFWTTGTTSIHQHGFLGAFQVLAGSSLHTEFDFETHESIGSFIRKGALNARAVRVLERGAVHPIHTGDKLIHSLFHLDVPSVTIVVRTPSAQVGTPQFNYHRPGIAISPPRGLQWLTKMTQGLILLQTMGDEDFGRRAAGVLARLDLESAVTLLFELFWKTRDGARFQEILRNGLAAHRPLASFLEEVFLCLRRDTSITTMRSKVLNPDHRFLLALLLNVDRRETVLELVRQRTRSPEPVLAICDMLRELSEGDSQGSLGVTFDETTLAVLEQLLRGRSPAEALHALEHTYGPEAVASSREDLLALCEALRTSTLFGRLLGPAPSYR
ncbi:hypothetical protein [Corallococcus sp. 4LFB]|uniref:hypothetical protein n=1 Tax=Corallococcus sp. 4LFB TaxID=3383249 RepID=UPI00397478E9